ncbi:MAG: hypothetical protein CVU52_01870 [Deltaproteobacteria bacterium HGW-Deltaproteobacteria-10]|nr:MAG: hypothetical protein CVU52_01870 [Deltaproteobacteria bacterium HGW-Deltaproteobacteria-10]
MREEQVHIKNDKLLIEGLLFNASEDKGVVICHPHSLMGGSMHNNVVQAIQVAFAAEKYSTLRFNFRGVGQSTGSYDEGRGEQEDILAVCKYFQSIGISKITFAGYSFGSWVGSKIIERGDYPFAATIFISPPISYFDFNFTILANKIDMIVCGNKDQFCDIGILKEQVNNVNLNLKIIPYTDHFFIEKEEELINILRSTINNEKN